MGDFLGSLPVDCLKDRQCGNKWFQKQEIQWWNQQVNLKGDWLDCLEHDLV